MPCIAYRSGYRHQLHSTYEQPVPLTVAGPVDAGLLRLLPQPGGTALLVLLPGYAWDGPSGPAIASASFMRASLVHDALYQLMREGHLQLDPHRRAADLLLRRMCREDGMWALRAWWVYHAVRLFGRPAADPACSHPVHRAPARCRQPQPAAHTGTHTSTAP